MLRPLPPASLAAAAVALAVVAWFLWCRPSVSHTVAEDPGEPAPTPAAVTGVGWTWEPDAENVRDVLTGTHGPLLVFHDGVTALDGATGDELWAYRDPRGGTVTAGTAEGGRFVHLEHGEEGERTVTVFDSATGEEAAQGRAPDSALAWTLSHAGDGPGTFVVHLWNPSKDVYAPPEQAASWLRSTHLGSDDVRWETEPPEPSEDGHSCHFPGAPLARDGRLLTLRVCAADRALTPLGETWEGTEPVTAELLAFDNTSGAELWSRAWGFEVGPGQYSLLDLGAGEHGLPGFGLGAGEAGPAVTAATGPDEGLAAAARIVLPDSGEEPAAVSGDPLSAGRVVHADSENAVYARRDGPVHEWDRVSLTDGERTLTTVEEASWVIDAHVALADQYVLLDGNRPGGGASALTVPAEEGPQEGTLLLDGESTALAALPVPGGVVVAFPDRVVGLT